MAKGSPSLTYQQFIASEFESRRTRNPQYSLRAYARDLGLAAPKLSEILRGRCGLSQASATRIAPKLGLSSEETHLFVTLVTSKHARSPKQRKDAEEVLKTLQKNESFTTLDLESFKIIADWYHFAILELTETEGFQSDIAWIAQRLRLPRQTVQTAVDRLFEFGLLSEDCNRTWKQTNQILATPSGIPSAEIRKHHRQILMKAEEALTSAPIEERDFSAMTMSVSESDLPYVRQAIKKFRRELSLHLSKARKKERVYNLAIQFFPLDQKGPAK